MIHELSAQRINVLALIKAKLGEHHPLVTDIIEKLRNYTTEVPSFILSSMSKGHKRTPPLASHQRLPLFSRGMTTDFHQSVEAALIRCGVNMAFFDKSEPISIHPPSIAVKSSICRSRYMFATEQEYYEYISCQIKSAGFEVSLKKLKELLGATHPFVNIFRSSVAMDCESSSRTGTPLHLCRACKRILLTSVVPYRFLDRFCEEYSVWNIKIISETPTANQT